MTFLPDDERGAGGGSESAGGEVPPVEEDNLLLTYADAMELAEADDVAGGRDLLVGGLSRAEDLETAGEEWGEALVIRYRRAIRRYSEEYGGAGEE